MTVNFYLVCIRLFVCLFLVFFFCDNNRTHHQGGGGDVIDNNMSVGGNYVISDGAMMQ